MIKRVFFLILLLVVNSCSDDSDLFDLKDKEINPNIKLQRLIRAAPHQNYKELGWAIDLTGDFLTLGAKSFPVIDVSKFENDYNNLIVYTSNQRYEESREYYGNNASEYVEDVNRKNNGGISESTEEGKTKIFSGTITSNFSNRYSYSSTYSFAGYDKIIKVGTAHIINDPQLLQKYLTPEFSYYINNNYSGDFIVEQFGTHVLLDITLGGKLSFLYRSEVLKSSRVSYTQAGLKLSLFKFNIGYDKDVSTTQINNTQNNYLYVKSSGGTNSISVAWNFNTGELTNYSTNEWSNSVDFANSTVIQVNKVIPIYELIADPSKKAEVKLAVEKYIESKKVDIMEIYPLHRFYLTKAKDHFYSLNINEPDQAKVPNIYEGIVGYIYGHQYPGTIPLYRFYMKGMNEHFYSTTNNESWMSNYTYEGIAGYVNPNQVEGTIPLCRYFKNKIKDHIYTEGWGELGSGNLGYTFENIQCYVIDKNFIR